jgi:acetyltransferase-like isoleucine patch superfamily enzyme
MAYLVELGFHNHYRTFVHGPPERVHDKRGRGRRHGAILNTRSGEIHLAEGVVLGHNTMLVTGRHAFDAGLLLPESEQVPEHGYDITVGRGSWIASGAIVLGGVRVGEHAIVAAGAVVTRDVPDGAVVAGVPARVIGSTGSRGAR